MDASPPGRDNVGVEREEEENETQKEVAEAKDVEKGELGLEEQVTDTNPPPQFCMSRMQRLSTTNPLRLVINSATRVPPVSCSQPPPPTPPPAHSRSTPTLQIAAYGKGFVKASQDTWELFEKREMESIVDADMTSAICFLTGVCSGSICVIVVAAWTARVHQSFTATISILAFFIGYLMTRIAMALPQACVSCYYACYAENPDNRLFDKTIPDCLDTVKSSRDAVVPTPRIPRRRSRA